MAPRASRQPRFQPESFNPPIIALDEGLQIGRYYRISPNFVADRENGDERIPLEYFTGQVQATRYAHGGSHRSQVTSYFMPPVPGPAPAPLPTPAVIPGVQPTQNGQLVNMGFNAHGQGPFAWGMPTPPPMVPGSNNQGNQVGFESLGFNNQGQVDQHGVLPPVVDPTTPPSEPAAPLLSTEQLEAVIDTLDPDLLDAIRNEDLSQLPINEQPEPPQVQEPATLEETLERELLFFLANN